METTELLYFAIAGQLLFLILCAVIVYLAIRYKQQQLWREMEKKQHETLCQHKVMVSRIEEKELTMNQLAREIHDHFGQINSLIKINLHVVMGMLQNEKEQRLTKNLMQLSDMLTDSIHHLNRSRAYEAAEMMSIVDFIKEQLEYLKGISEIQTQFVVEGTEIGFSAEVNRVIIRIFQEAVSNILHHAQAKHIAIRVCFQPDCFTMEINDDGIGFELSKLMVKSRGMGIANMHYRAQIIKGMLHITSDPSVGSKICLQLPIKTYP